MASMHVWVQLGQVAMSKRDRSPEGEGGSTEQQEKADPSDLQAQPAAKRRKRRWDNAAADSAAAPAPVAAAAAAASAGSAAAAAASAGSTAQDVSTARQVADAKAVLAAKIKAQIAAKIAEMKVKTPALAGTTPSPLAPNALPLASANLSAFPGVRLATGLPTGFSNAAIPMKSLAQIEKEKKAWKPLILDEHGRAIDESGRLIKGTKKSTATLSVNKGPAPVNPLLSKSIKQTAGGELKQQSDYFDNRVGTPSVARVERAPRFFNFVKPGKYVRKAGTMRMKQLKRDMKNMKYEAGTTGGDQLAEWSEWVEVEIPEVEWWDLPLVANEDQYEPNTSESGLKPGAITALIHHPVPLAPVAEAPPPPPMPLMLTKKERKKLRRMRKMEKQKEIQEKTGFGLLAAAEPRLKISNMMRVLGEEAVALPSTVEAQVRKAMKVRQAEHEANNAARRLTTEQKRERLRAKLKENTSTEVHIAVFKAGDLTNPKRRFKVDVNAQQYNLSGCVAMWNDINCVVVEGGPKGIKRFKRLMLNRIKWTASELDEEVEESDEDRKDDQSKFGDVMEESDDEEEEDKQKFKANKNLPCSLVWEGVAARRNFKGFHFENCRAQPFVLLDLPEAFLWSLVTGSRGARFPGGRVRPSFLPTSRGGRPAATWRVREPPHLSPDPLFIPTPCSSLPAQKPLPSLLPPQAYRYGHVQSRKPEAATPVLDSRPDKGFLPGATAGPTLRLPAVASMCVEQAPPHEAAVLIESLPWRSRLTTGCDRVGRTPSPPGSTSWGILPQPGPVSTPFTACFVSLRGLDFSVSSTRLQALQARACLLQSRLLRPLAPSAGARYGPWSWAGEEERVSFELLSGGPGRGGRRGGNHPQGKPGTLYLLCWLRPAGAADPRLSPRARPVSCHAGGPSLPTPASALARATGAGATVSR
eukprot:g70267.t1